MYEFIVHNSKINIIIAISWVVYNLHFKCKSCGVFFKTEEKLKVHEGKVSQLGTARTPFLLRQYTYKEMLSQNFSSIQIKRHQVKGHLTQNQIKFKILTNILAEFPELITLNSTVQYEKNKNHNSSQDKKNIHYSIS
jgi:hypothetical protein